MTPTDWTRYLSARTGTQAELAADIGITPVMLSQYASGIRPTPRKVALAVAAVAMGLPSYGDNGRVTRMESEVMTFLKSYRAQNDGSNEGLV